MQSENIQTKTSINSANTYASDSNEQRQQVVKATQQDGLRKEPYEFEKCTISIGIQLLPDDGSGDRQILIGVRNHSDPPLLKLLRQSELGDLPPVIVELLTILASDLPNRKSAWEKKRDSEEATREKQKTSKTSAPRKSTPTSQLQAPSSVKGNGISNLEKSSNVTGASATQMSLFDIL